MSAWRGAGLTTRIAVALAVVAVASVGISTVLANLGLHSRVDGASRARTLAAADHAAEVASALYARDGRWTNQARAQLAHAASIGGYRLNLETDVPQPVARTDAAKAVVVDGRIVGTLVLSPAAGGFVTHEDRALASRLDQLHLLAAGLALLLGLLAAPLIASALTRPLRRIAGAAEKLRSGDLDVRVNTAVPGEIAAVGEALNELATTLEREETLRRDAAADVAHELRTPLTGVIFRIEAAQDQVVTDEQANLRAMRAEAQRLVELLDDLERLADAQRPGMTLNRSPVDISELAHERLEARRHDFEKKGVKLSERLEAPAIVFADRARLTQVIDNLLTNALRYTDAGEVRVDVARADDEILLSVADTGIGMSTDQSAHAFERFWRADPSRSRGTGGTGVGLAIAKELTEAQNGAIAVVSEPGVGSTFKVTFPALTHQH